MADSSDEKKNKKSEEKISTDDEGVVARFGNHAVDGAGFAAGAGIFIGLSLLVGKAYERLTGNKSEASDD